MFFREKLSKQLFTPKWKRQILVKQVYHVIMMKPVMKPNDETEYFFMF